MNKHIRKTGPLIAMLSFGVLPVRADYDMLGVTEGGAVVIFKKRQ